MFEFTKDHHSRTSLLLILLKRIKKLVSLNTLFFLCEQQFEVPEDEAEWVGLSMEEAVEKQRQLEYKVFSDCVLQLG